MFKRVLINVKTYPHEVQIEKSKTCCPCIDDILDAD